MVPNLFHRRVKRSDFRCGVRARVQTHDGSRWENCAMPKRSSISKRRSKALSTLGFAGMSLSMASGACASTSEASANTPPPSQKHEIFLGEEEISDVSLATFYVFDKEAGSPPLFQKPRLAVGGGAGCGCSFGCAYWPQPPQPPKATQPTQPCHSACNFDPLSWGIGVQN